MRSRKKQLKPINSRQWLIFYVLVNGVNFLSFLKYGILGYPFSFDVVLFGFILMNVQILTMGLYLMYDVYWLQKNIRQVTDTNLVLWMCIPLYLSSLVLLF